MLFLLQKKYFCDRIMRVKREDENKLRIILASGSPRRKELLKMFVPEFEIIVSGSDESLINDLSPDEQATNLSYLKAKNVFNQTDGDRIVIGSDTIVVKNEKIYGKPKSKEHAKQMIKDLLEGDKTHYIITGLSIIIENNGEYKEYKAFDKVKVYFTDITDAEIEKWIDIGKAFDRAGAYGIQDEFCVFVEKIEGNYSTAVGLPVHKVYDILKEYI